MTLTDIKSQLTKVLESIEAEEKKNKASAYEYPVKLTWLYDSEHGTLLLTGKLNGKVFESNTTLKDSESVLEHSLAMSVCITRLTLKLTKAGYAVQMNGIGDTTMKAFKVN